MSLRCVGPALALLLAATSASMAQINYAEPPDLLDPGGGLGGVAPGLNTVQGSLNTTRNIFGNVSGDQTDAFSFVVTSGVSAIRVEVVVTGYFNDFSSTLPRVSWVFGGINIPGNGTYNLPIPGTGTLGPGVYSLLLDTRLTGGLGGSGTSRFNYTVRITAESCPPEPPAFTAAAGECQVRIDFASPLARRVELYRSIDPAQEGVLLTTLDPGATGLVDQQVVDGVAYIYRARIAASATSCGTPGSFSPPQTATPTVPGSPGPLPFVFAPDQCPTFVTWGGVTADAYTVQCRDALTDALIDAATVSGTSSYTVPESVLRTAPLSPGRDVYFRVAARRRCANGGLGAGDFVASAEVRAHLRPALPQMTLTNLPCGVLIEWVGDRWADEIFVQRVGPADNQFLSRSLPEGSTSFLDTQVTAGATYQYWIQMSSRCGSNANPAVPITVSGAPPSATLPHARVVEGEQVTLVIPSVPGSPSPSYAWRRGGTSFDDPAGRDIVDGEGGGRVSGATTPALSIQRTGPDDTDQYWCIVRWDSCAQSVFARSLFLASGCAADFNRSGQVSVQDIFDFLAAYFAGCP